MTELQTPPDAGETITVGERIRLGPFIGLSFKNLLLNIITLSLYRFWAKTEIRRRIWSAVSINGEPFEYTGRGGELFVGFLIALVTVGVPFLAVSFAIQFVGKGFIALLPLLYLGFYVLYGAALFLAFRYIASRTRWRGVRFQLKGSPWGYSLAFLGYSLLTSLTLGWFAPAMTMRLAERLWGELRFGDQKIQWRRPANSGLYGSFAVGWVVAVLGYFALIMGIFGASLASGVTAGGPPPISMIAGVILAVIIYSVAVAIAFAAYGAAVLRNIAASLRLGEARFTLKVGAFDYMGLYIVNIALILISFGILMPLVEARTARFLIRRLSSTGEAPLALAMQAPGGPKSGEGLADAFGISPI